MTGAETGSRFCFAQIPPVVVAGGMSADLTQSKVNGVTLCPDVFFRTTDPAIFRPSKIDAPVTIPPTCYVER